MPLDYRFLYSYKFLLVALTTLLIVVASTNSWGLELDYSVTITNPGSHKIDVSLTIRGLDQDHLNVQSLSGPEGYAINVLDLEALNSSGGGLHVDSYIGQNIHEQSLWKVSGVTTGTCTIKYTVSVEKYESEYFGGNIYYGYLDDEFGVLLAAYVFLYPQGEKVDSLSVRFNVPDSWEVLTPWPNNNLFEIEWPGIVYGDSGSHLIESFFAFSAIILGDLSVEKFNIEKANIWIAFLESHSEQTKLQIKNGFRKIYEYFAEIFQDSLTQPYLLACNLPSRNGEFIYGGTNFLSQTITLQGNSSGPISNSFSWSNLAFELVETRWIGYQLGYVGGESSWYKAGASAFYSTKCLFKTGVVKLSSVEDMLHGWVEQYKNLHDKPLSSEFDHRLFYSKGPCVVFLLAKEIFEKTSGKYTIEDFDRHLFKLYWGKGHYLTTEELLMELNSLTGENFTSFFDKYVYGTSPLPMTWFFDDRNHDGESNLIEFLASKPLCRVDNLPDCTVQTECEGAGGYWYDNVCNANPSVPVIEGIPVPTNQSAWDYVSIVNPIKKTNPSDCKPFAVGDLSSANLNLQVGLPAFSQGVDVYLAIGFADALFLIDDANGLQSSTEVTVLPLWKSNVSAAIDESLYGDISISLLPSGVYNLYIAVTPAGETDFSHFYFWSTSFNINH